MDGNSVFLSRGTEAITLATTLDNNNQHEEALEQYKLGIDLLVKAEKYEKNPASKQMIKERILAYMVRAEKIKEGLHSGGHSPKEASGGSAVAHRKEGGSGGGGGGDKKVDEDRERLKSQVLSLLMTETPNVKWEDVAGLEAAKDALKEAVILPVKFPQLFTGKRKPWRGILLYGPPGTGKSFLAAATATEAKSAYFSVTASGLMSKWIGEGEKLVKVLFEEAHERRPSVVFVDEIDSIAKERSEGESEASRRMKTELMAQMDGVGKDSEGVLVLGATNVPWELDLAFRRRFTKRIYIPLPEAPARAHMFQLNLGNTPNSVTPEQFAALGATTDMYSGSDIKGCTQEALFEPVRKCQRARQFKMDAAGYFFPCEEYPSCPECPLDLSAEGAAALGYTNTVASGKQQCASCKAIRMSFEQIPDPSKLKVPDITFADFGRALTKSKPSVDAAKLQKFADWTAEFGSDG